MLNLTGDFGERVARRLEQEEVIWLTTVRADGTPQPSPVWFLWMNEELMIYSQPNTPKLRNIAQRPRVALNFNSNDQGGNIVVFAGDARIDEGAPSADEAAAYIEKYRDSIVRIGATPEGFDKVYSVVVRVRPTSVRGF